jgi:hypothetical protein
VLLEAVLLLLGGFLFGAMFNRSGLWDYTRRVFAETRGTFAVLANRQASDDAKELAAREGTVRLARFGAISLLGMAAMGLLSAIPTAIAVWLGQSDWNALWLASIHPGVLIAGVVVFVIGAKL